MAITNLIHLCSVLWLLARYRLNRLLPNTRHTRLLHWLCACVPAVAPQASDAVRLRLALQQLGPIFVKFGQMLSTRKDLLSPAFAAELAKLQDQVPAFDGQQAQQIIEAELGQPVGQLFRQFKQAPLASASIAQVHEATLPSGEEVVVKVLRPGIKPGIQRDLKLLFALARFAERLGEDARRLRPVEVVTDYETTINDEMDLLREAGNCAQLRRNFHPSPLIYVPDVYWDLCRAQVMVMERIYGIPVADVEALRAQGTDMRLLAERGVEIFFTQVFRDNFFHADMHTGNIFVSRYDPANPQYIAVDCGIIGSLSSLDQRYLAENLLAFFRRDYTKVAQLHVDSGWVPADTRVDHFEAAIRSVCEPIFQRPLHEISFGQLLLRLFQTGRRFKMEVQPQLVLLQKTLLNIEGLGRQLYPELDLWATAQPFLERWLWQRMGPENTLRQIRSNAPFWLEKLPELPGELYHALGAHRQQTQHLAQIEQHLAQQATHKRQRRSDRWLGLGACAVAGLLLYPTTWAWLQPVAIPTLGLLFAMMGLYLILRSE